MRLVEELSEALKQATTKVYEQRVTIAKLERDAVLKEAKLSTNSIMRLHEAFKGSTDNAGLRQAIHVEQRRGVR